MSAEAIIQATHRVPHVFVSEEALDRLRAANMDCREEGNEDLRIQKQREFIQGLAANTAVATQVGLGDTITND